MTTHTVDNIQLESTQASNGRTIAFATTILPGSDNHIENNEKENAADIPTVVFFYPLGANRRLLGSWRELFHPTYSTRLICINRPGKNGTSSPLSSRGNTDPGEHMMDTTLDDIVVVLDHLRVDRVSVFAMCAGSPFAMTFCARYPERTTGHYVGLGTWVQPGDVQTTKWSFRLGVAMPGFASPLVAAVSHCFGSVASSIPDHWIESAMRGKLLKPEQALFDKLYGGIHKNDSSSNFVEFMRWMREDKVATDMTCVGGGGSSSETLDLRVLLGSSLVPYDKFAQQTPFITLWHGEEDALVHVSSVQWLAQQLKRSHDVVTLHAIPEASHQGLLFGVHHSAIGEAMEQALGLREE